MLAVLLHKLLFSNGLWKDQSSQKDLKTIVYAKVEGAEYYFYGGFGKKKGAITTQCGKPGPNSSSKQSHGAVRQDIDPVSCQNSKQPFALKRNSD